MAITVTDYQPDDTIAIDSFIMANDPTGNYGTFTNISIGYVASVGSIKGLFGFSWIWNSLLNRKIKFTSDLKLSLYVISIEGVGGYVSYGKFIKRAWVESQVTWNIYSTGNNWQTAGGEGANDSDSTNYSLATGTLTAGSWFNFCISAGYLQGEMSGVYSGILLVGASPRGTANTDYSAIASSSNATAANRPKYSFSYEPYHKVLPISAGYGGVK